ncbi:MAG TPA: hypothetical protein VI794_03170 [Patescibacteria group bacterium]|nr:hypothetical protein [Patescibacteria group bacterium]
MTAGASPLDLTRVLARCEAGQHQLTKLVDLQNIPGTLEWCRNCGSLVATCEIAEPQTLSWKPRVFTIARQSS